MAQRSCRCWAAMQCVESLNRVGPSWRFAHVNIVKQPSSYLGRGLARFYTARRRVRLQVVHHALQRHSNRYSRGHRVAPALHLGRHDTPLSGGEYRNAKLFASTKGTVFVTTKRKCGAFAELPEWSDQMLTHALLMPFAPFAPTAGKELDDVCRGPHST